MNCKRIVAGLPHAQGRMFFKLDAYLAHLVIMGQQDRPYYEKVGHDRYKLQTGRGGQNLVPQFFTREELLEKFGFCD